MKNGNSNHHSVNYYDGFLTKCIKIAYKDCFITEHSMVQIKGHFLNGNYTVTDTKTEEVVL